MSTHIHIIGPSGGFIRLKLEMMGDLSHLSGSVIDIHFLQAKMMKEPLELVYSDDLLDYLIPLIRESRLVIPPVHLIAEFGCLLQFLAGDCKLWIKYASMLNSGRCYDVLGATYDLKDTLFTGACFTKESQALFTLLYSSKDGIELRERFPKFEIRNNPNKCVIGMSTSTEDMLLKLWRRLVCRSAVISPPIVLYNTETHAIGWEQLEPGSSEVKGTERTYNEIDQASPKYNTICAPSLFWLYLHVPDVVTSSAKNSSQ